MSSPPEVRDHKKAILVLCCIAQFMVILDLSIVNVALPSIQVGLKFSSADLQWVVDAYAIVFAGFLMLAGRATDIFGQRRTFLTALSVFSFASLAGGLAPTGAVLVIARGIQGLGGAMMAASSLAILTATFEPGPERRRAVAAWGSMNGAGGAAGVFLSGLITQEASWRWVLLINAPIGIATIIVATFVVAERRSHDRKSFDLLGALVLTGGLLLQAYGAVTAGTNGWGSASALLPIAIGSVLLATFPWIEARAKQPLIPPHSITRHLKYVNVVVLLFSAALFPMWYVGSLYMQQVLSLEPITTGIVFLPMALTIMVCAQRAGRLVGRFGIKTVLTCGLTMMTCGILLFARIGTSGSAIQYIVLPGILTAAGIGLSVVTSTIAATQTATSDQAGLASGLVNTSRQVGGGLGLAVLISIATLYTSHQITQNATATQALTAGFRLAYLIGAGLCAAAALLTLVALPGRPEPANRQALLVPLGGLALVLAVFAGLAFGIPRTQGKPIGHYVTNADTYSYVSAPNLHPPVIKGGSTTGAAAQLPGDILIANFYDVTNPPIVGQSGPLVLSSDLQPLWFKPVPTDVVASNLNEQTYDGKPVLTWWQGDVTATGQIESGEDIVVNQHYQTVAKLRGKDGWVLTLHEMQIVGDDAWVTANKNVRADLAKYGGVNGGAMIDSAVQEYNLKTGKLIYTWDVAKHVSPSDSYQVPPSNSFPWDAYHVNSIDVLSDGDFLVSLRNTWAMYLVNGHTGRIIWTLGGKKSDFALPAGDQFEWQHDAQLIGPDTVSVFDDHCCDISSAGFYLPATGSSRGMVIKLNPTAHAAKVEQTYSHGLTFESEYMGNVQQLSNGDVWVGWGEVPYMSEFSKSGQLIYDAVMPTPDMTYRSYVKPWTGLPLYPPSATARIRKGKTTVYVSWNGATDVSSWRVLELGSSPGTKQVVASQGKTGFETDIPLPSRPSGQIEVQGLNSAGKVIGTSKPFSTNA